MEALDGVKELGRLGHTFAGHLHVERHGVLIGVDLDAGQLGAVLVLGIPQCFTFPREHEDIVDGVAAGKHRVEVEDFDFGYGLYADGVRVASFAEGRIGYRERARRNAVGSTKSTAWTIASTTTSMSSWPNTPHTYVLDRANGADDLLSTCPVLTLAACCDIPRLAEVNSPMEGWGWVAKK